ncbi:MAG TPA: superoxide dismutase family protein [Thermoanaerobaculia bacterium]|nr:superoxide dismutase family protein [Thermoanaerobaculia bacterium]
MRLRTLNLPVAALAVFTLLACGKHDQEAGGTAAGTEPAEPTVTAAPAPEPMAMGAMEAQTTLASTTDTDFSGTVRFVKEGAGLRVIADLRGIDQPGSHGLHVHETGDCSAHDFHTAGGHFNPANTPHGCPPGERHAGDFGNVEVAADGTVHFEQTTDQLSLDGPNSVVGKALILHTGTDDCQTQPTGNSGDRLACGVVQMGGAGAAPLQ